MFATTAEYFGQIYRSYLGKNATPKVQLLEKHVPCKLAVHKLLGLFGEDPIERLHHKNKILNQLFSGVKRWEKKEEFKMKRLSQENIPEVAQAQEAMISCTQRKFNKPTKASVKQANINQLKQEKYVKVATKAGYVAADPH